MLLTNIPALSLAVPVFVLVTTCNFTCGAVVPIPTEPPCSASVILRQLAPCSITPIANLRLAAVGSVLRLIKPCNLLVASSLLQIPIVPALFVGNVPLATVPNTSPAWLASELLAPA